MVFEPAITCPIEFDFSVSLSTSDGSAGVYRELTILLTHILFIYFFMSW